MHLLLAEDDKISRDLLRRIIESEAHTVTLANDGDEAWALLQKMGKSFDACVFDICMPQISGLELVERMRADDGLKRLPVIICTAVHDRATVQRAGALGVGHYVLKPYSRTVMLEKLRQIRAARQDDDATPMEAASAVCSRLGIDADFHREMIGTVLEEANGFARDLRAGGGEYPKLFIRARGLSGSCLTFGLKSAAGRLDQIETVLQVLIGAKEAGTTARDRLHALVNEFEADLGLVRDWLAKAPVAA